MMATKIINGILCSNKKFEVCYEVAPGWYSDEGLFDISSIDDERFRQDLAKILAGEEVE
jgi:hypothetical protein